MPASEITLEHAKKDKLFYFVANVLVYREDGRCLLLRRSMREKVHPGKYCNPGGKLEWSNLDLANPSRMNGEVYDFENAIGDLLARELKEEANVDCKTDLTYINNIAFVRPDGIPVILLKFAAEYAGGEIKLEAGDFDEYAWVNSEEAAKLDHIRGVPDEIRILEEKLKLPAKV